MADLRETVLRHFCAGSEPAKLALDELLAELRSLKAKHVRSDRYERHLYSVQEALEDRAGTDAAKLKQVETLVWDALNGV
jgi:hypothetical protein